MITAIDAPEIEQFVVYLSFDENLPISKVLELESIDDPSMN